MIELTRSAKYKFKYQPEVLFYVGKEGLWHQFEKEEEQGNIWCELLDSDLHMIEPINKELEK